ncbi:MAG: NAD-binding protein [Comamonadaceae bacterium]|nr:NAD-binding protein [Comamonadaceae bacterium]
MLDAPVSGGPAGCRRSHAWRSWSAASRRFWRALRPLLEVLGKTITHIGPNGAGQVAKACNQMVMVAAIEGCAEALLLAQAAGVDPGRVRAALQGGAAGSRVLDLFGERMLRAKLCRRHRGAAASQGLRQSDARRPSGLNVPLPLMAQVRQQLVSLMALGWGGDDTSSLLRVLESAVAACGALSSLGGTCLEPIRTRPAGGVAAVGLRRAHHPAARGHAGRPRHRRGGSAGAALRHEAAAAEPQRRRHHDHRDSASRWRSTVRPSPRA